MDDAISVTRTRTIQVYGAYSAETNTLSDSAHLPGATAEQRAEWRKAALARLDAELDAWDQAIRGRARAAAEAARDAKPAPEAIHLPVPPAPAMPTTRPPQPTGEVSPRLRERVATAAESAGKPAIAQAVREGAPIDVKAYKAGTTMAANDRICSHAAGHNRNSLNGRERGLITAAEWDFSIRRYGKPLCRLHQAEAPRGQHA